VLVWVLSGTGLPGCAPGTDPAAAPEAPARPAWFEDVTEEVNLNFTHDAGVGGRYFFPEIIGSGAALFDYDNDGRLDVYLVQNGGPGSASTNRLFHQGPDGRFTDVSKGSGLDVSGHGMGVAVGDVNNDGRPDVLVTEYRGVRLFLNNGDGTFTEVTRQAGLDDPHWAVSAAFVDYDRDGWLDLVVVNYVDYVESTRCTDNAERPEYCGPRSFAGTAARLYHNLGRRGAAPGRGPTSRSCPGWALAGARMPSATSSSPTTAPAISRTSRRPTRRSAAPRRSGAGWPGATWTATAPSTCW
jgi:hypothetical protein